MKKNLFIILFFLSMNALMAQQTDCQLIHEGNSLLRKSEFIKALKKFNSAQISCDNKSLSLAQQRTEVLVQTILDKHKTIIKKIEDAKIDTLKILQGKINDLELKISSSGRERFVLLRRAQESEAQVKLHYEKNVELEKKIDELQNEKIKHQKEFDSKTKELSSIQSDMILKDKSLNDANKLISDFYTYGNKFTLNIDEQGYFLKEISGINKYKVVYDTSQINIDVKALDLTGKKFTPFPNQILNHTHLEILILNGKYSKESITVLPNEITQLINLKYLDLRNNLIPQEEQEKIRKLLPNCEIVF